MGWMHVEPQSVQALNDTTFLATYASGILAEEIGAAVERIENWLGRSVVITCDEVTTNQLPQVVEHAWHITGVDSVVLIPDYMICILILIRVFRVATQLCQGHQV